MNTQFGQKFGGAYLPMSCTCTSDDLPLASSLRRSEPSLGNCLMCI